MIRGGYALALLLLAVRAFAEPLPATGLSPWLLVTDPPMLKTLEGQGATLAVRLGERAAASNRALLANSLYSDLVTTLESDLNELRRQDPSLAPGMRSAHRLFAAAFLRAETAHFELVGVVNRLDRRPFVPNSCGEIRLIYRLAYAIPQGSGISRSRLPLTINLVYFAHDENGGNDCRRVAALLAEPPTKLLSSSLLLPERIKAVEVNFQSVRWPSTVRPDLAGHAEYLLRVFHKSADGKRLVPAPLENTPDVERLQKDYAARQALRAFISAPENLQRLEEGTVVLPEQFLARRVTSFSPRGLARLSNRPFRQLFTPADFSGLDLKGRRLIGSAAALLRRLDGLSCAGCHQSRSVAGFHVIGADVEDSADNNSILVAASPHLLSDEPRRRAYVQALLSGKVPDPARPLSERADVDEGGYGSHCGLFDAGFATWNCRSGFVCTAVDETDEVGICLPVKSEVGDPCEIGPVRANADAHRDRIVQKSPRPCPQLGVCQSNYAGFPAGMCSVACTDLPSEAACGGIPQLRGFNDCLSRGQAFSVCIRDNIRPNGLRACNERNPCRDDYICARSASAQGVCMPPYFLFQMRVDGHPNP